MYLSRLLDTGLPSFLGLPRPRLEHDPSPSTAFGMVSRMPSLTGSGGAGGSGGLVVVGVDTSVALHVSMIVVTLVCSCKHANMWDEADACRPLF